MYSSNVVGTPFFRNSIFFSIEEVGGGGETLNEGLRQADL